MRHSGLTLVETLVVVGLTSLIMGALGSLLVSFYRSNAFLFQQGTAVLEARRGIENTVRYLREASNGSDGSSPITEAATSSIAFWADVDDDGALDTVSYSLASAALTRTITLSTGSETNVTISAFVGNGTSTPIFQYYGSSGTALTEPVNTALIKSVQMTLITDVDPQRLPPPLNLSGTATLRNSNL